jgi:hypothetical protein
MKYKYLIIILLLGIVSFTSCNDTWEEHYNPGTGIKSNLRLYDYISSQPDLTTFAKMLKIAGCDSILNKPQTYTVWAPVNSGLTNIDLKDTTLVTDIVKNHISRFSYPTSGVNLKTVYMLDQKLLLFQRTQTGFTFGGKTLLQANTSVSNGILHKIDGYVPYLSNIWEFIGKTSGLDSLRAYLYSQNTSIFNQAASVEIGTNSQNQAVYDSVIIFSNPVLDKIGHLQIEDSTFSAILPNNTAWTKVYNLIKSNYKTLPKDGGAAQQRLNTQYAIVRNLVFKSKDMLTEPIAYDSLISTTGTVFSPSSYLFDGATKNILSNGFAYVTDSLRFNAVNSWQQPIIVEAENSNYGRSYLYSSIYLRSGLGSAYNISQNQYLVCEPTTVSKSTQNSVTFPIPNTLSGKYNIYCVLVPSSIVTATDTRQNKVRFSLSYTNTAGLPVTNAVITATNGVSTVIGAIGAIFTTNASVITKMFVTQFSFPYCNLFTAKSAVSDITVKLKVENAAVITETVNFDRTLRIDYIILEPVQ